MESSTQQQPTNNDQITSSSLADEVITQRTSTVSDVAKILDNVMPTMGVKQLSSPAATQGYGLMTSESSEFLNTSSLASKPTGRESPLLISDFDDLTPGETVLVELQKIKFPPDNNSLEKVVELTNNCLLAISMNIMSSLSNEEFKEIADYICSLACLYTQSLYSAKGHDTNESNVIDTCWRYACVRRGKSNHVDEGKTFTKTTRVQHVDCKASFVVYRNSVRFPRQGSNKEEAKGHCEECKKLGWTEEQIELSPNFFSAVVTTRFLEMLIEESSRLVTNDASLKQKNIKRQLDGIFSKRGFKQPPNFLYRRVEKLVSEKLHGKDANNVAMFINSLKDKNIPYDILLDELTSELVTAVAFRAGGEDTLGLPLPVVAHDCTFGVVDNEAGYPSFSLLTGFDLGKNANMLVGAILEREDTRTFSFILNFALKIYPCLRDAIWFSDEDRAFMKSLENVIPESEGKRFICLWHKAKHFKKHRRPRKNSSTKDATTSSSSAVAGTIGSNDMTTTTIVKKNRSHKRKKSSAITTSTTQPITTTTTSSSSAGVALDVGVQESSISENNDDKRLRLESTQQSKRKGKSSKSGSKVIITDGDADAE